MIAIDQLRRLLRYDEDTGCFIWLVQRTGYSKIGKIAGVGWHARARKWQAQIGVHGKIVYLGLFYDVDAASTVYANAASQFFGEFARRA